MDIPHYSSICEADKYVRSIRYVTENKMMNADVYVFINRFDVQQVCVQYQNSVNYFGIPAAILGDFEGQHAVRQLLLDKGTLIWKG